MQGHYAVFLQLILKILCHSEQSEESLAGM